MKQALFSFNRGRVSPLALARVDQKRVAMSAEIMTNWIPRTLGPMSLRPGLQYLGSTASNAAAKLIKFIFSTSDTALIELTNNSMRVWVDDALITRASVSTAITNGTFASNLNDWTDSDEAGGTSAWVAAGYMGLTGNGTAAAIRDQEVTVAAGDQGVEHALRIVIARGPVTLRVGSTAGDDDYIAETSLETGEHSLALTPAGNFHVRLMSRLKRVVYVDSVAVESAGVMSVTTTWESADLRNIRYVQSGDVLFVACEGQQQRRIERRSATSWSFVRYAPEDGPFEIENVTSTTLTPSATSGNITLTASSPVFKSTDVGGLFSVTSSGQEINSSIASENTFSNPIEITGVGSDRTFTIVVDITPNSALVTNAVNNGAGLIRISAASHGGATGETWVIFGVTGTTEANGTWVITVIDADTFDLQGSAFANPYVSGGVAISSASTATLQRSLDSSSGPWSDVSGKTWSADTTETYADGLDNQIVWYRIGVKTGDYNGGTVDVSMTIALGSITGVARVTGYTNSTTVSAEVLTDLGGTVATDIWAKGSWSDRMGWPTAVKLHEGRLWWAGIDRLWGSISDAYDGFDPNYEGDAGPIARSIGAGPVDTINWILSLQRMIIGGQGAELSVRSSSLDEPLTPTNFVIRAGSGQGSAAVQAVEIDQRAVYVQRGGTKVYELAFSGDSYDYDSTDMMLIIPEMGDPGIISLDVQRQPDTRIHCVRSDGTVALSVYDKAEDVLAWVDIETDGLVEDVVTLPSGNGQAEDRVYYVVNRTINGSTVRYLEKWALETECRGGALNKQADSFVTYTGAATTSIPVAHLEGESVVVWANGEDVGTASDYTQIYTVSSGVITLATASTNVVVGLPYTAQFKSSKLSSQNKDIIDVLGALIKDKRVNSLGILMAWVHPKGLRYGPDFDNLDDLPDIESGIAIDQDTVRTTYSESEFEFPGTWSTNSRLCLKAQAPRPVTVLAAIPDMRVAR